MRKETLLNGLEKPLTFFDMETTGTSIATDRIVEISLVKINPDGSREIMTKRINPGIPIPAEATAVHGITNEDVAHEPVFAEVAREIHHFLKGCDLAGYNILRFDLPLLVEEMHRAGNPKFPQEGTRFIDAISIFHHFERRDLTAALKFYCDKDLTDAHSAEADTLATVDILNAQVERYRLDSNVEQLQEISTQGNEIIDFAGKFTRNGDGDIVFTFGAHNGERVVDNRDYVNWMLGQGFTYDTKKKAVMILKGELV